MVGNVATVTSSEELNFIVTITEPPEVPFLDTLKLNTFGLNIPLVTLNKKSVSVLAFLFVCAVSVILSSCSDELDIQQSYPFKVETMPVPKDIVRGQTVEIRCELKAEGKFDGTIYTIRYFQHDGKGSLRMENGTVFQPNDRYLLENEKFRLYYTSASTETQTLTVVVEDNFGKSYEMEFNFNDTDDEEEEFARSANKPGSV